MGWGEGEGWEEQQDLELGLNRREEEGRKRKDTIRV